nr:hypothetical protein [Tanacetum cinerariifolium]
MGTLTYEPFSLDNSSRKRSFQHILPAAHAHSIDANRKKCCKQQRNCSRPKQAKITSSKFTSVSPYERVQVTLLSMPCWTNPQPLKDQAAVNNTVQEPHHDT